MEISAENLAYLGEIPKIISAGKGTYSPPEELPEVIKKQLKNLHGVVVGVLGRGWTKGNVRAFIRGEGLTEEERFWGDAIAHARERGLQIIPIARFEI